MKNKLSLFWFRRDLRLHDNTGLAKALNAKFPVLPIFIFDPDILEKLENKEDRRVDYIQQVLNSMNDEFRIKNSNLLTFYEKPLNVFQNLTEKYSVQEVYCNRDYEPKAIERDTEIYHFLKKKNIAFKAYKDQVIFDKNEILTQSNAPYKVYSAYAKKWKKKLAKKDYLIVQMNWENLFKIEFQPILTLQEIGFKKTDIHFSEPVLDSSIIEQYDKIRDFPAQNGTSRLGIALRFGTISIRKCVAFALKHNETWLSELIWREFFMQILYHFPKVMNHSFKPKYDRVEWRNNEKEFELWCRGKTGFPLVDAGMRELNQTGYMHNRVRMLTASFLVKDLLVDWRWGEAYFAEKLDDYDLAANNGNWQWAAGCGCDAAPYFRIFNPETQLKKFDKNLKYIKKWIPEYGTESYPKPITDHKEARERALMVYQKALHQE